MFPIIYEIGERHGIKTLAMNGTRDHLHWLTKFSSTTRLCDLVKDAKGASSRFANSKLEI
jgi:REP element-mobilizing transposase RayT